MLKGQFPNSFQLGCLPFTKSLWEIPWKSKSMWQMELGFSNRSRGEFPGAAEHLKR